MSDCVQNHLAIASLSALDEDLLTLINGKELYGLQIIASVKEISRGKRQISPGSLYPTLKRLEDKGLIAGVWGSEPVTGGARRKYYQVTDVGGETLKATQDYRARLAKYCPLANSQ
ncbi:transcriptional regulator, PadR family protein [Cylindrospermum sp. NIES-4074]|nr:transcriptional regulator, PadR family protein [Cylindrospermum sp. NIES-4074]